MAAPTSDETRPSHAELLELLEAPDLTPRERRQLQRAARFQKRVETWEARQANPVKAPVHRVVVSLLMMAAALWLLWLLLTGPTY